MTEDAWVKVKLADGRTGLINPARRAKGDHRVRILDLPSGLFVWHIGVELARDESAKYPHH